jgi:choline transport protein
MSITELVYQCAGSRAAEMVLKLVIAICFMNGTNGAVTAVSRLMYSLARDGGVPSSN